MIKIGFICPTYNALELDKYTRLALSSFFETTPNGVAIVVDDNSKDFTSYTDSLKSLNPHLYFIGFNTTGGLTRSWNAGLTKAQELNLDYVIAGNNDVVFTNRWYEGLLHALTNGYAMAGPLSNAPGTTAKGIQEIDRHTDKFQLTDDRQVLNMIADDIYTKHLGKVFPSKVNGFFQIASMDSWIKGKYDKEFFYKPYNRYTSKGYINKTPTMTLNEDELQARWEKKNMLSAVVLSSYIFHYRAVSRGDNYKKGKWFRKT